MEKIILFLTLLLLPVYHSHAQGILWANKNYGSLGAGTRFNGFTVDKNGNTYVCGTVAQSGLAPSDSIWAVFGTDTFYDHRITNGCFVVYSLDSNGAYRWAHGWPNVWLDLVTGVLTDGANNLYILGNTNFDTLHSSGFTTPPFTFFLMKMSSAGNVVSVRNFGFGGLRMSISPDNSIYIDGIYRDSINFGSSVLRSGGGTPNKGFIAKLDSSLNKIWAFNVGCDSSQESAIEVANDSVFYVAGSFQSVTDTFGAITLTNTHSNADNPNYFIAKYDSSGHNLWAKNVSDLDSEIIVSALGTDANNNVYFGGSHRNAIYIGSDTLHAATSFVELAYLIKYNSNGGPIWGRQINADYTQTFSLTVDQCNNIWTTNINTGYSGRNLPLILSFDSSGNRLDTLTCNGFIQTDLSGNLYIAGNYDTISTPAGAILENSYLSSYDITVAKYKYGYSDCSRDTIPIHTLGVATTLYKTKNIQILPNPASATFVISGDAPFLENSTAQIYDVQGRMVKSCFLPFANAPIAIDELQPGVYVVRVTSSRAESVTLKLTVLR